jgi:fatty acid synthase, animal type
MERVFQKNVCRIFQNGVDFDVAKLYPPVDYPVARGTPMISPLIKWDHSQELFVPTFFYSEWYDNKNEIVYNSEKEFNYIHGHVIDGNFEKTKTWHLN